MIYDAIIMGAGPAGLFAALTASEKNSRILIIEKNSKAGRKLLMSGSGRCNITNNADIKDFFCRYGDKEQFVKPALKTFTNKNLIDWFEKNNIKLKVLNDNKVFPESEKASDILDLLLNLCSLKNINIMFNSAVESVVKKENIFCLGVRGSGILKSRNFIIASGGCSYPSTGSSGDGYGIAEKFGHCIIKPEPALTPVYVKNHLFENCSGIALENITLKIKGKSKLIFKGDLLFTHKGFSGPLILDSSRFFSKSDIIEINMTAFQDTSAFEADLIEKMNLYGKKEIKNILTSYEIPEKIIITMLDYIGISPAKKACETDKKSRRAIAENLTAFKSEITELGSFNEAMATSGGVSTAEVERKTMESKIVKGLFFSGEVMDVDGDTGGFNLQFAFSSGYLAGSSLNKEAPAEIM